MLQKTVQYIQDIARIPGFSSFEEIYHPHLLEIFGKWDGIELHHPPGNSLIVRIPGESGHSVAISSHIDKINHFGENPPKQLPVSTGGDQITGQMDDAAGVGLCLALGEWMTRVRTCSLYILLTEMEEGMGLREHPHLMKKGGKDLHHGLGAERVSRFLIDKNMLPEAVITLDTTPLFRGAPGVSLYSGHWEFTEKQPGQGERDRTGRLRDMLMKIDPDMLPANNTNDYLTYGRELGSLNGGIPSVAVEPAIFPYHQKNERVFIGDIDRVLKTMQTFLGSYKGPDA
ncbi:MAG: hypothetical protein LC662_10135 [Rhodothermaceae bacterium]|nr:hypothetical protein [Rhodothermaceae bacterium]